MLIEVQDVCKTYKNGIHALSDVNLSIDFGEFVFLTGASGAGKTTLFRLLFREELPTSGDIKVSGRSMLKLRRKDKVHLRRNTGVVFQDFRLLERYDVFDNVAIAMRCAEAPAWEIKKRVPELLERVSLAGREKENIMHLSGGEQQRVAVARALANNPQVLFADEPTGDLDPNTSEDLMDLFSEINLRGVTVIIATHDKLLVDKLQRRVILLDRGHIVNDVKGGWLL